MVNIALLDRLRRHLRAYPQYHDQGYFSCGTSACAGGWAVALEGGAQAGDKLNWINYQDNIEHRARKLLRLTYKDSLALFFLTSTPGLNDDDSSEQNALALIDAFISREKGELSDYDRSVLNHYGLSLNPGGGKWTDWNDE